MTKICPNCFLERKEKDSTHSDEFYSACKCSGGLPEALIMPDKWHRSSSWGGFSYFILHSDDEFSKPDCFGCKTKTYKYGLENEREAFNEMLRLEDLRSKGQYQYKYNPLSKLRSKV